MREILETKSFRRDIKRMLKRGKNRNKLFAVIEKLVMDQPLESRHRPHRLTGNWEPYWECHIEPDWLLVYEVEDDFVKLISTGTHADLFG